MSVMTHILDFFASGFLFLEGETGLLFIKSWNASLFILILQMELIDLIFWK